MLLDDLLLLLAGCERLGLRQSGSWGALPAEAAATHHLGVLLGLSIVPQDRLHGMLVELTRDELLVLPAVDLSRTWHELWVERGGHSSRTTFVLED